MDEILNYLIKIKNYTIVEYSSDKTTIHISFTKSMGNKIELIYNNKKNIIISTMIITNNMLYFSGITAELIKNNLIGLTTTKRHKYQESITDEEILCLLAILA